MDKQKVSFFNSSDPDSIFNEGYGLLPNKLNFSRDISDAAKLLYVYIASLTAKTGWCYATNKHLAEKYGKSQRQIIRLLNELINADLVFIQSVDDGEKRKMTVFGKPVKGGDKNVTGGVTKMSKITDANNINNNINISSETLTQIEVLHRGYVKRFKLDNDRLQYLTPEDRDKALESALKRYKLTPKRKAAAARRLKDCGFDMCKKAIINCSKSPWHRGDDPKSNWFAHFEWIFQSYEKVEEWANK